MKTLKTYLFALVLLLVSVTVFVACDEDDDTHTHEPIPVTSTAVEIIASNQTSIDSPNGIWQDTIELDKSCLLIINAHGQAGYSGGGGITAGIRVQIRLNGELIASDLSLERPSNNVDFNSSASTTIFLQPGNYNLEVERFDFGVNRDYNLNANYHAIYAEMSN
jgi:hypothetical protein